VSPPTTKKVKQIKKMKRREFIKKIGLTAATYLAAPYILPSGRVFAKTASRKVNHVVFCLFAGGIRNIESVQKAEGNLMPHLLKGNETISSDIMAGIQQVPRLNIPTLQSQGTLFKEFRYKEGPTGHFNGHTTALTGAYTNINLDLRTHPAFPTIFEYYRKHSEPNKNAMNAWWISDSLGPYPALNFSNYEGYGANYGANFMQPASFISLAGYRSLGNTKNFSQSEFEQIKAMREFLDDSFAQKFVETNNAVRNSDANADQIEQFIKRNFDRALAGEYNDPLGAGAATNNDMFNIFAAGKVIQEFKPELLVVNMTGVDVCHSNYTQYCNNLRKADYAAAHLWNTIQNTEGMKDDTVMIIVPEHGRNLEPNSIRDSFGRLALDHTSDQTSRELFCMIVGNPSVIKQDHIINEIKGESIDIVPTIAHLLGFYDDIPQGLLKGKPLYEALV
jgi:hypothetical protein